MDGWDELALIQTREDFVSVIERFLKENDDSKWENKETTSYLDAVAAVVDALEGRYANRGEELPDTPTWKMFAEILLSATQYE